MLVDIPVTVNLTKTVSSLCFCRDRVDPLCIAERIMLWSIPALSTCATYRDVVPAGVVKLGRMLPDPGGVVVAV